MFETEKFYFVGNNLSLDFVNTLVAIDGEPKDLLQNYADLAAWAVAAKLVSENEAVMLLSKWKSKEAQTLREATGFRSMLHNFYSAMIGGKGVRAGSVAAINNVLRGQRGFAELVRSDDAFEKRFHADFGDPLQILTPIAESAADLLCFADLGLVKKCENPECVIYFYDTTKNHRRRWCTMAICGNRAKAAAFYQRKKSKKA